MSIGVGVVLDRGKPPGPGERRFIKAVAEDPRFRLCMVAAAPRTEVARAGLVDKALQLEARVFPAPDSGPTGMPEIAAVPGIDAIFMGSFDLAHSMGLFGRSSHPDVVAATERVTAIAKEAGIPVHATLVADTAEALSEEMARWKRAGARIFNIISDRRLISLGLAGRLDQARKAVAAG